MSVLDITAPGIVSLNTAGVADLLTDLNSGWLGDDTIAVTGGSAYVGKYPGPMTSNLALVDLTGYGVSSPAVGDYPVGVAMFSPPPPVGGMTFPASKFALLAPWVGLAFGAAALGGVAWYVRRRA